MSQRNPAASFVCFRTRIAAGFRSDLFLFNRLLYKDSIAYFRTEVNAFEKKENEKYVFPVYRTVCIIRSCKEGLRKTDDCLQMPDCAIQTALE